MLWSDPMRHCENSMLQRCITNAAVINSMKALQQRARDEDPVLVPRGHR